MESRHLTLLSPAKINLRLEVLGKREDGYHEIESVMTLVSLYDEISIAETNGNGIELTCSEPSLSGDGNIAHRAAAALMERCPSGRHIKIDIVKKIPVAAGLGGGSSNAAAVLMGLNRLLGLNLSKNELMSIGVRLGADVPFFILERAAIAGGIGEKLREIDLPTVWMVLVNPNIPVSTSDVYKGLNRKIGLTKNGLDINISHFNKGLEGVVRLLHNDLEDVAIRLQPTILEVKEAVSQTGAAGVLMSGSGATVFGIYKDRDEAERAYAFLSDSHKDWRVFLAQSINRL